MRVLLTTDTVGGVWTYTREMVLGLVRNGIEVVVVSFGNIPTPAQSDWLSGLRGVTYLPTAFRLEWMQDAEHDIEASTDYVLNVVREFQPDVLHFNQYCYGNLQVDVPRIVVAHSDVVSWWKEVHGEEPPAEGWAAWYRQAVAAGLGGADAVVAPSRWMLDAINDIYAPTCPALVIYNGRSGSSFAPHAQKQDFAITVGRLWDQGKNAGLVTRSALRSRVVIAGSDSNPDGSKNDLLASPSGKLELRSAMDEAELRDLYSHASIYIVTSQYEPFGLAPLEAAFSKCAIVANDIPSLREVWGDTACYFRRNDAEAMAETVDRLMDEKSLRTMYSVLAYTRARMRYSANRMVEEYIALYQSISTPEAMAA